MRATHEPRFSHHVPRERDNTVPCTLLTILIAVLLVPVVMLAVAVSAGVVMGLPVGAVLTLVFAGAPVSVAFMVPEIYGWLKRNI